MKLVTITRLFAVHLITSVLCCDTILVQTIPQEIVLKIFELNWFELNWMGGSRSIDLNQVLKTRLLSKSYDKHIVAMINQHLPYLTELYSYIKDKKRDHFQKPEAFFLNRFPNLLTHIDPTITEVYFYLFYQNFSFCANFQDYAALYEQKKAIAHERIKLFEEAIQHGEIGKNHFLCSHLDEQTYLINHGIRVYDRGRECCFSAVGFLFFDSGFYPPPEFWNEPYSINTTNSTTVLISLSFHPFFAKALKNFIAKIPEYCKCNTIEPVLEMEAPSMFFGIDYEEYFKNFTKPLLQERLKKDPSAVLIEQIKPMLDKMILERYVKSQYQFVSHLKRLLLMVYNFYVAWKNFIIFSIFLKFFNKRWFL